MYKENGVSYTIVAEVESQSDSFLFLFDYVKLCDF